MFDFREYVISISAVFLALALGLLIGISYGEDIIVSNQRETIVFLERELLRRQHLLTEREEELARWENLKPLILAGYSESLNGKDILVLAGEEKETVAVRALLEGAGAATTSLYRHGQAFADPVDCPVLSRALQEALTAPEGPDWEALQAGGFLCSGNPGGSDFCCYILFLERVQAGEERLFDLLWKELHRLGFRVIAVSNGNDGTQPAESEAGGYLFVENVDTFRGQLALLEMVRRANREDLLFP